MLEQIKNKHILVDGDIYKYRCAASAEKTKYLVEAGEEFHKRDTYKEAINVAADWVGAIIWSRKEVQPLEFALQACKTAIDALLAKLSPSKVSIFLSPEKTFRHTLATTRPYKGNRTQPKPKYLKEVEQYLVKQYGATFGVNVEADDEIGVHLSRNPDGAVSVSIDKDLLQVPGWHYDWVTDRVQWITPREGDFRFYSQMLQGDATDNIPGISGIGPKSADKLLSGARSRAELCSRVWNVYRGEFNDSQKARDYFFEQAQLLWILREEARFGATFKSYIPPIELRGE